MEKDMNSLVSGTIFPSQLCREAVESEVIGGASARGRVIPNPVRLPLLKERQSGQRQIAMVARCSPIKNVEAFFRLHETLLAEGWEHKASLVSEKTGDTKIPASIEILAPMPYEALCDFYQQQGLLVASSYFETFGNVPMEALCLGTPVLVNRNMGSAEILSACGFEEMICDFSDTAKVAVQAKALCGQSLDPEKVAKAREILDPGRINKEISDYLSSAIK
jgi:glycosyltransferase involved in cell wall biosynthesis